MDRIDMAASFFQEGFSCSQAVLSAFNEEFGLDRDLALKLSTPFGGGMARMGETCGAVSGALMVIGLKYGRVSLADETSKEKTYRVILDFVAQFKGRHGAILCKELLGCEIGTQVGRKFARDQNYFQTRCPGFVRSAVEIAEKLVE